MPGTSKKSDTVLIQNRSTYSNAIVPVKGKNEVSISLNNI